MGCVGLGNQPDRLATSLAAPMEPWMSLMEDAVICESGSKPDNMPCSSEQGASDTSEHREEGVLNATAEETISIYSASLLRSVHKTNIDTPNFFSFC